LRSYGLHAAVLPAVASAVFGGAIGFCIAAFWFLTTVQPEYKSWADLLKIERDLLPVVETILQTRTAHQKREAEQTQAIEQRELALKEGADRRDAELKAEAERLSALRKYLEEQISKIASAPTREQLAQLQSDLTKERAVTQQLRSRVAELEQAAKQQLPPAGPAQIREQLNKLQVELETERQITGQLREKAAELQRMLAQQPSPDRPGANGISSADTEGQKFIIAELQRILGATSDKLAEKTAQADAELRRAGALSSENKRLNEALAAAGTDANRRLATIKGMLEPDLAKVAERIRSELPCSQIEIGFNDDLTGFIRGSVRSQPEIDKARQAMRESSIAPYFLRHELTVTQSLDRCAAAITREWALRRTQGGEIAVIEDNEIEASDRERLPESRSCQEVGGILDSSEIFQSWNRDKNRNADVLVWVRAGRALRQCWRKDGRWQFSAGDTAGWPGLVLLRVH
jgi:hypothetical protein